MDLRHQNVSLVVAVRLHMFLLNYVQYLLKEGNHGYDAHFVQSGYRLLEEQETVMVNIDQNRQINQYLESLWILGSYQQNDTSAKSVFVSHYY